MVTMVSRALKDMAPRLDEHASFLGWCPEIYSREVYADGGVGFAKLFVYLGPRRGATQSPFFTKAKHTKTTTKTGENNVGFFALARL